MKELTTCVNISADHTIIEDTEHSTSREVSSVSFTGRDIGAGQTAATVFRLVFPLTQVSSISGLAQTPGPLGMEAQRHTDGSTGQTWPVLEKVASFSPGVLSPRTVHLSFTLEQLQGNQPARFYSGKCWLISKFYLKISQTHRQ